MKHFLVLLAIFCTGFAITGYFYMNRGYKNPWKDQSMNEFKKNFHRLSPNSLNRYALCDYSQYGEEGILEEIFRRLNIKKGFFVEFGAEDGISISNTRRLWEKGWEGAMIECNQDKYRSLIMNYSKESGVIPLNYFITWKKEDYRGPLFDEVKQMHFPDREIDFLSIDVDGADYYILKSLKCRPKVILIENNLYWHPLIDKEVPEKIAVKNQQQPLKILIQTAREMGYEPVCMTINLFLVRKDLYAPFKETPSDALTLWRDAFRALPIKENLSLIINEYDGIDYSKECPITKEF